MRITKHKGFIDVCCKAVDIGEVEIVETIRQRLADDKICVTDDAPGRVGHLGTGTIFRFKLKEK